MRARGARLGASLATLLVAAMVVVPAAAPVEGVSDNYAAVLVAGGPTVTAGKLSTFSVKVANCPSLATSLEPCGVNVSTEPLSRVTLTLPQGFIVNSEPGSVSVQTEGVGTTAWQAVVRPSVEHVHDVIDVAPTDPGAALLPGESLKITFDATPQVVGTHVIATDASGLNGGPMTLVGSDPSVQVVDVVGQPGTVQDCDATGTCTATATDGHTTVTVTATGTDDADTLTVALIARETERCEGFAGADGSKGAAFYVIDGGMASTVDLKVTWRLDGATVNLTELNGRKKFNACFGGRNKEDPSDRFATRGGGESTPIAGVQWGILPDCSPNFTEPCVSDRKKTQAGDVVLTVEVPSPWDPTVYGGP